MAEPTTIELDIYWTLLIAVAVLYVGRFLTIRIKILDRFNIPEAVCGGLLCSILVAVLLTTTNQKVTFNLNVRDALLLVFFSTIGLSAKLRTLVSGGKLFAILVFCTVAFLVLQDIVGIGAALALGSDPAYGLIAGSIAFAGGHGSAISYGQLASDQGLPNAVELGLACATFGLIAGGLVGGPIARRLISKHDLSGEPNSQDYTPGPENTDSSGPVTLNGMLDSVFVLAICVAAGGVVNKWLEQTRSVPLPGFLTAMFVGIAITNAFDFFGKELPKASLSLCSDVSLQLFLAISLMSLQLNCLQGMLGPLFLVLFLHVALTVVFAISVIFPLMGRTYDAAVIAAGFSGLGLGATPVGIANMHAVTEKFGASAKAFLIIPLVGAFFLDIANATILQLFLMLPLFGGSPA